MGIASMFLTVCRWREGHRLLPGASVSEASLGPCCSLSHWPQPPGEDRPSERGVSVFLRLDAVRYTPRNGVVGQKA